ncbi:MAG: hypothetical protein IKW90_11385 [Lachnospiraceae bacterium]|nr:hypothetical protein [Lachnospiraceae bacterium]
MYVIIRFIGLIIRQFILPNPFETMWPERAFVINWAIGLVLLPTSYAITGRWYHRGEDPMVGSLMFNFIYICLSLGLWGILLLAKAISDNKVAAVIIASVILGIVVAIVLIIRHLHKKKRIEVKSQE